MKAYYVQDTNQIRIFDYTESVFDELSDAIRAVDINKDLDCIELSADSIELLLITLPGLICTNSLKAFSHARVSEDVNLPTIEYWQSLLSDMITLRPFQIESLIWMECRRQLAYPPKGTQKGMILSLDQGLGKTVVALAWDEHLRQLDRVEKTLIICLNNNKDSTWRKHVEEITSKNFVVIGGDRLKRIKQFKEFHGDKEKGDPGKDIAIIHYEAARLHAAELVGIDHLIIDEAHKVANHDSKQSKVINKASKLAAHTTGLTGGVAQNRVEVQLWHPLHLCDRPIWPSYAKWMNEYCILNTIRVPIYVRGKIIFETVIDPVTGAKRQEPVRRDLTVIDGLKNREGLSKAIAPYIYKKSKWEVGEQLPPKIYQIIHTGLTPTQRKLYIEVRDDIRTQINGVQIPIALTKNLRLLQVCATLACFDMEDESKKADEAVPLMLDMVPHDHKALVFTQHVKMANAIFTRLQAQDGKALLLTGENPKSAKDKDVIRDQFKEDDTNFLVTTIQLEGTGANYPMASFVFRFDRDYRPEVNTQAEDRAHRLTSDPDRPVNIIDFVTKDTIEEGHLDTLADKKADMSDVYGLAKLYTMADIKKWLSYTPKAT